MNQKSRDDRTRRKIQQFAISNYIEIPREHIPEYGFGSAAEMMTKGNVECQQI